MEADTEVIAICDGYWPDPPVVDHPKVTIVHHTKSIGQRAATNEGARISQAKYVMKLDAHCTVDKGFDGNVGAVVKEHTRGRNQKIVNVDTRVSLKRCLSGNQGIKG